MKMWQYFGLVANMFLAAIVVLSGSVQAAAVMCGINFVVAIISLFANNGENHDSN